MKGFKQFLMRGNVIDLAVAVVIGAAFTSLISSLVRDLLTPLIAAIVKQPDFSNLFFTVNGSRFTYGNFINALISFLLISAAVYYAVVLPMTALAKRKSAEAATPQMRPCPECLSTIPMQAKKCAHCGSPVASVVDFPSAIKR